MPQFLRYREKDISGVSYGVSEKREMNKASFLKLGGNT